MNVIVTSRIRITDIFPLLKGRVGTGTLPTKASVYHRTLGDCAAYSLCSLCKLPSAYQHPTCSQYHPTITLPARLLLLLPLGLIPVIGPGSNHSHGILVSSLPRNISPRAFGSC